MDFRLKPIQVDLSCSKQAFAFGQLRSGGNVFPHHRPHLSSPSLILVSPQSLIILYSPQFPTTTPTPSHFPSKQQTINKQQTNKQRDSQTNKQTNKQTNTSITPKNPQPTPTMGHNSCPKCGAGIAGGGKKCGSCGAVCLAPRARCPIFVL